MTASPFAQVELAPRDPILGVTEAFRADARPGKVNLGVGVYNDEHGKLPLLAAVREAERVLAAEPHARGYLPIEGQAAYIDEARKLLFAGVPGLIESGRVCGFETLGGTGALKVGADFLHAIAPKARAWISAPSWENHRAIFEGAGFEVGTYPYFDAATNDVDVAAMIEHLASLPAGDVVVLHACCHNPTGVDLTAAQWKRVIAVCAERGLVPFLDLAYQGFAEGIDADAAAVHAFVESGQNFLVATSFSKSFSLYGERVGALCVLTQSADEAARVNSRVKRVIRSNYSSPPTHGASVVATVLANPGLRATWESELANMRNRIREMREGLVRRLAERGVARDFSFIARQRGMFSYSGLTAEQVQRLIDEHAIYAIASGRICVAALNLGNIDRVADAIAAVIKT